MANVVRKRSNRTLTELHEHRRRAEAHVGFVPPEIVAGEVVEAMDHIYTDPDNPAVWYEAAVMLRAAADALNDMTVEVMSR